VSDAEAAVCPVDRHQLTVAGTGAVWCPECEWNLDTYEPDARTLGRIARRLDRVEHRVAFRLDAAQFAQFAGQRPSKPGWTPARMSLVTVSVSLLIVTLALVAGGLDLIVGSGNAFVLVGVILVLIGIELRPRLGRHRPQLGDLARDEAPALRALVGRVAAAIGAPRPAVITITPEFNASCARVGVRRRVVLMIGLPLWVALGPQARLALLGHELGHLVNGDPGQGLLTQPALQSFGRLAAVFDPQSMFPRRRGLITKAIFIPILWTVSRLFLLAHLLMVRVCMRDWARAEYLADAVAVDVAGTGGACELMDRLLFDRAVWAAVRRQAGRSDDPATWQTAAAEAVANLVETRRRYEQLSIRHGTSMLATHPPAGRRVRLVRSWPAEPPRVLLSPDDSAEVDRELIRHYTRIARNLTST